MIREVPQRYDIAPGVYLELIELVLDHKDYKGRVIHQEVVKRIVTGENVPDHILEAFATWWTVGFARPVPEKIQQFLHSLSAAPLNF